MRRAARVDDSQPGIVAGLRAAHWSVYYAKQPWDLLVSKAGRSRWVECKSPGGTLTRAQVEFLCTWRGEPIVFGRDAGEVLAQIEEAG